MAAEGSSASSSSADTSEKQEVMKKAAELLAQGKRNMVCGEVPKAVSLYEEAVQMLVKECGELSRDCADAYFKCGSALLELGRMETNVLGQALEGVDVEEEKEEEEESEQFEKPPADEGEERQKLREEVYEAMAEGEREEIKKSVEIPKEIAAELSASEEKNGTTEVTEMETDAKSDEKTESIGKKKEENLNGTSEDKKEKEDLTKKDEQKNGKSEKADSETAGEEEGEGEDAEQDGEETAEGEESQEGEEENEGDKEEDVPNFQLAWEYLDLAKVIFLKNESKEDQLKAAECHIKLGEVSMETEQHATAAEDLQSALTIQQKFLPPEDRLIAETHYQLGLAYGLGKEFELSIQHYQQAISVIEAKIASLNKLVEENEVDAENKENRETDELKKYKDEIKELQELIPEMKNKIEDTQVEAKDLEQMKQMAKEALGLAGASKAFGSPIKKAESGASSSASADVDENGEKKATDIAHLIRKKRKPEDDVPASTAQEIKKLRQDESAAGDAATKVDAEIKVKGTSEVIVNGVDKASDEPLVNGIHGASEEKNKIDGSGAAEPMAT